MFHKHRTYEKLLEWINLNRPLAIQFDITNFCNLNCNFCYHVHHKNDGVLPLERWLKLLDEYSRLINKIRAKPFIIFCGGEPTTSSSLLPMISKCFELWGENQKIVVITNGTLIAKRPELLSSIPKQVEFQVSLDGPNAPMHDFHRGPGRFSESIRGIRALASAGHKIHIMAVLSRANYKVLPQFFDLARELNVDQLNFTRLVTVGAGRGHFEQALDPSELRTALLTILAESSRTVVRTKVHSPLMALIEPSLGRSGRFWESLVVDYKGNYLVSSRSRIQIGHIDSLTMENALTQNPYFRPLIARKVENCGRCELYEQCGGDRNVAYAATGNFLGKDPGCWK